MILTAIRRKITRGTISIELSHWLRELRAKNEAKIPCFLPGQGEDYNVRSHFSTTFPSIFPINKDLKMKTETQSDILF